MDITLSFPKSVYLVLKEKEKAYGSEEKYLNYLILQNLKAELKSYQKKLNLLKDKYGSYPKFQEAVEKGEISQEDMKDSEKWHEEWKDLMKWKTLQEAKQEMEKAILKMK